MQNLEAWLRQAKGKGLSTAQLVNDVREYLQIQILKAIYQSQYKRDLSFMGGTSLRICYDLKRYSEDLDFTLDRKRATYSFLELNEIIVRFLKQNGFAADRHVRDDKVVQKSFIRVPDILPRLDTHFRKSQKLHIKLEVDTRPVKLSPGNIETYFIVKFDENFPILKHTNDVLFAGKVLAVLKRAYTKGRDYYDLIWYLKNNTALNLDYINRGLRQAKDPACFEEIPAVIEALRNKVHAVSVKDILADLLPFLADPSETAWLKQYQTLFAQVAASYLKGLRKD